MRLLGIVDDQRGDWGEKDPYDRVLLEPWAVEAALARGRRLRLTSKHVSEIRRCTRNGHDLRLPESSTWMMMIVGFGLTGAMVRRRRMTVPVLA